MVEQGQTVCQKAQEPISLLEVDVPFGTVVNKKQISLKRVVFIRKNFERLFRSRYRISVGIIK